MTNDLIDLIIKYSELEKIVGLEISDTFMGKVYRSSLWRYPKRILSFLLTELFVFGLIIIFCLPVGLIVARNFNGFTEDSNNTVPFLGITLGISVAIACLWNLYMWFKVKEMKALARLLDEVDRHNEIIQGVQIVDELSAASNSGIVLSERHQAIEALNATRETLVCALMTERILRKHQRFIARRYELFANIESNLATLQHLQVNSQANEYADLIGQALQIGAIVRQEIDRLNN
ncbi:MAG: hypothetical protein KME17_02055 [Cyanosarcina radialis HA8281-LM2]|jgi:hypothetical protein|nr:hypothetical protein [Cyanosarcina radialis HA8281-LM2]